jgi:aspartyl/asparaginyl beta-hydroxylase (cupin superfamily)
MQGAQYLEGLVRDAVAALHAGRADEARSLAERATALGVGNAQAWLLLATACRAQNDPAGEENALDRLLAIEPRMVRGLIMKGDCRARAGDDRAAVSFYRSALHVGSQDNHPQPVLDELRRAETIMRQLEARYAGRLEASLSGRGLPPGQRSARFQQSLDIIAGRKQVFLQEPTVYYFPGLPQRQYYDPAEFAWAGAIEAAAAAIRTEIEAVRAGGDEGFRAYIQAEHNNPRLDENPLLGNRDWSALFLCENGRRDEAAIARCPSAWEAAQAAPLPRIADTAPTVMFSLLRPGARISPHTGVQNTRLTCHLPLIVPSRCGFRVGNEVREWEEGKLLIFDDTIEHEAWNDSGEDRLVLIFDIWRPELTEQERREVTALFTM